MPAFLVTYKFGRSGDFGRRIDTFTARLQNGDWWGETPSTIVVHAEEDIDRFFGRITSRGSFDEHSDMVVVIDLDNREGRARGHFRDAGLFSAAPWIIPV
jgi:hypothetical protein